VPCQSPHCVASQVSSDSGEGRGGVGVFLRFVYERLAFITSTVSLSSSL